MLRRIFDIKTEIGKRNMEEIAHAMFHNLYSSPYIIRVVKSRRMRWEEICSMHGRTRNACKVLIGNIRRRYKLRDLGVGGNCY
jgi:hypothetical protein